MDVNGQLHNSTTLPLGRVPGAHWKGGWVAAVPTCTFWRTGKSPTSARNQRSLSWSSSKQPVNMPNTVSWHQVMCPKTFKRLKMKCRTLYLRPSSYRAVNTFHLGYKNQSVYAVSGTTRCSQINTKHKNTVWAERTVVEC
jgi:hypothetical protein